MTASIPFTKPDFPEKTTPCPPFIHAATSSDAIRLELEEVLKLQRAAYFAHPYPTFAERKADLLKLKAFIKDNRDAIVDAISADYLAAARHEPCLPKSSVWSTVWNTPSSTSRPG